MARNEMKGQFSNPKERSRKLSKALKGRKLTEEWKKKIGASIHANYVKMEEQWRQNKLKEYAQIVSV